MRIIAFAMLFMAAQLWASEGKEKLLEKMEELAGEELTGEQRELLLGNDEIDVSSEVVEKLFDKIEEKANLVRPGGFPIPKPRIGPRIPLNPQDISICYEYCKTDKDGNTTCHEVCVES